MLLCVCCTNGCCRELADSWKAAAAAARPLPPGLHYSSTMVTAAVLAAAVFEAEREKYEAQGGLNVNFIVNCRGGR